MSKSTKSAAPKLRTAGGTFKLLPKVGSHFEPNPEFDKNLPEDDDTNPREIEYGPGDRITSRRDLDRTFPGKFERLERGVPVDMEDDPVRSVDAAEKREQDRFLTEEELEGKEDLKKSIRKTKPKAEDKTSEYGKDVTEDFELAAKADLLVFEKNKKYTIVDPDDLETPVESKLDKKGVLKYLKSQTKE